MNFLKVILTFTFLVSLTSATSVVNFCVADFRYPIGPAGFPCMNPANLTADDFVLSSMHIASNKSNRYKANAVPAVVVTFPALNGLGLSMARLDLDVGGVIPIHSHRVSEIILVIEGTILAGFIGSDATPYYKTLSKGDIMVFPPTLLHFQVNTGNSPALAFVSLNSPNPGFQATTFALAAKDLPTDIIQKITLLDEKQVTKLKRMFGDTN